ncbi:GNAT family N-acetyltransferase [Escherichia coli]|nr:GNAT family N-acetyltransferase [Escherichia coli]
MIDTINNFRKANSPETSQDELKLLSLNHDEIIRAAVVHNSSKPISCVEILFNDKSDVVQEALAMNGYHIFPQITKAKKIVGKTIVLRNANQDDAEFIVRVRTDQKKGRFISSTSTDVEQQRDWLKYYESSKGQAYFIIENYSGERLGTIRMYDQVGDSFCWGSWVIVDNAPAHYAIESALLLYTYALKLGFAKSHFDVRKGNTSVIKFHERFGAKKTGETELDILFEISKKEIELSLLKYKKYLPDSIEIEI